MADNWKEVVAPLVRRFEVCAAFGDNTSFNPESSKAMAGLLKRMARLLDEEQERRNKPPIVPLTAWEKVQVFFLRTFTNV